MSTYKMRPERPATATVTALTGAAPQTITGSTFVAENKRPLPGTLFARVYALATTNLLTIAGKWQSSSDGSNWFEAVPMNAGAQVTLVTGTGSAVTRSLDIEAPASCYGAKYCRYVLTSGVASGNGLGQDEGSITYGYAIG